MGTEAEFQLNEKPLLYPIYVSFLAFLSIIFFFTYLSAFLFYHPVSPGIESALVNMSSPAISISAADSCRHPTDQNPQAANQVCKQ